MYSLLDNFKVPLRYVGPELFTYLKFDCLKSNIILSKFDSYLLLSLGQVLRGRVSLLLRCVRNRGKCFPMAVGLY